MGITLQVSLFYNQNYNHNMKLSFSIEDKEKTRTQNSQVLQWRRSRQIDPNPGEKENC